MVVRYERRNFDGFVDDVALGEHPFSYDSDMADFFRCNSYDKLDAAKKVFGLITDNFVHTFHNSMIVRENWRKYGNKRKGALETFRDGHGVCVDLAILYNTALKLNGIGGCIAYVEEGKHAISSFAVGKHLFFADLTSNDGFGIEPEDFNRFKLFSEKEQVYISPSFDSSLIADIISVVIKYAAVSVAVSFLGLGLYSLGSRAAYCVEDALHRGAHEVKSVERSIGRAGTSLEAKLFRAERDYKRAIRETSQNVNDYYDSQRRRIEIWRD